MGYLQLVEVTGRPQGQEQLEEELSDCFQGHSQLRCLRWKDVFKGQFSYSRKPVLFNYHFFFKIVSD